MKRHYRIGASILLGLLAITALSLSGCSKPKQPGGETDKAAAAPWSSDLGAAYPVVEGLHVTGQPVDIDAEAFRLKIGGAVETPLSLSLSEIRGMKAERRLVTLVCPGFFVDEGHWTGVRISDLLDMAGVKEGATRVEFLAADGSYRATLRLEEIGGEGMLIAYAFEDKPLPKVHGYPLRVVAKDQPGNRWVKWLGEIVVQ